MRGQDFVENGTESLHHRRRTGDVGGKEGDRPGRQCGGSLRHIERLAIGHAGWGFQRARNAAPRHAYAEDLACVYGCHLTPADSQTRRYSAVLQEAGLSTVFAESIGSSSLHPASHAEPSDWGYCTLLPSSSEASPRRPSPASCRARLAITPQAYRRSGHNGRKPSEGDPNGKVTPRPPTTRRMCWPPIDDAG
jgi:hypothetical protein